MTPLKLAFMGPPEIYFAGQRLTFATRKTLALLAYLAIEGGSHPRSKLMVLLWPESDAKRGRGALRITLVYLRRALNAAISGGGDAYLVVSPDTIAFNFDAPHILDCRLPSTAEMADRPIDELETILARVRGDFFEGFFLKDCPEFDDWLLLHRRRLQQAITRIFDRLTQRQLEQRLLSDGIDSAGRWVSHDWLHEPAYRRLMHLLALAGDRTTALRVFQECRRVLADELGVEPSPETSALAERIDQWRFFEAEGSVSTVNRPSSTAEAQTEPLPFVGRRTQFATLVSLFEKSRQGHPKAAIISGEPGIGKSRLAAEFLYWAAVSGADCLAGQAFEAGGRLPYQPLVTALRPRLDRENAPEDLLADVWLAELSRLLPELRDRYPDLPPASADESTARTRLPEAIARLITALARRREGRIPGSSLPLIFFVDDVQWADSASLDTLAYGLHRWSEEGVPIVLLLGMRRGELAPNPLLPGWLAQIERIVSVSRIQLESISAGETIELVRSLAGRSGAVPSLEGVSLTFARWLYQETLGQPFYIHETLKVLAENRAPNTFVWEERPDRSLIVPGVKQLIQTRLQQLPAPALNLLTAAAVVGQPCTFDQLCRVAQMTVLDSLGALEALVRSQLLLEKDGPTHPYQISHDKIRAVVYEETGEARRRFYHRQALEVLLADGRPAAELAHQAAAAELPDAVLPYALAAGLDALALFAVRDAIAYFEQARAAAPIVKGAAETDLTDLYLALSRAYELAGNYDLATEVSEEMLIIARERGSTAMTGAAFNRLAGLAIYTHRLDQAAAYYEEALRVGTEGKHHPLLAETEWGLAQLTHHRYDMRASRAHSARALVLAEALGQEELAAGALNNLGYAYLLLAEPESALTTMQRAHQRYAALGNRSQEADSLTAIGGIRTFLGQFELGIARIREALSIYRKIENPWGILFSSGWLAAGLLDAGQPEEALRVSLDVSDLVDKLGTTPVSIWNHLWTGNAYRALGQIEDAIGAHRAAAAMNEETPLPAFAWYAAAELCADYWLSQDWDQAFVYAQRVLAGRTYEAISQIVLPQAAVTAALLAGGAVKEAEKDLQRHEVLAGRLPRFRIGCMQARALIALSKNNLAEAVADVQTALDIAQTLALPLVTADTAFFLARITLDEAAAAHYQILADETLNTLADHFTDPEAGKAWAAALKNRHIETQYLPGRT